MTCQRIVTEARKSMHRALEMHGSDTSRRPFTGDPLAALSRAQAAEERHGQTGAAGVWFHIDAIDSGMPVVCILTSASVHDSQVAIPLAEMTAQQITQRQPGRNPVG